MQNRSFKIFIFFISITIVQSLVFCQSAEDELKKYDSLYSQKKYQPAFFGYDSIIEKNKLVSPGLFLKTAQSAKAIGKIPDYLFYLKKYHQIIPNDDIQSEIETTASENNLTGYELSEWDLFLSFYIKSRWWIISITLSITIILFLVLFIRFIRNQTNLEISLYIANMVLLIFLFTITNFEPDNQLYFIDRETFVFDKPTVAGSTLKKISRGSLVRKKLQAGKNWLEVSYEKDKQGFVKKNHLREL